MNISPAGAPGAAIADRAPAATPASGPPAAAAKTSGPTPTQVQSQNLRTAAVADSRGGQEAAEATSDDLLKAQELKALIANQDTQVRTYRDENSGRPVLQVTDKRTGVVVEQYPSEELLRLYAAMREPFVDQSA
jgi:uncharacterized FlaG/YvyC family protein